MTGPLGEIRGMVRQFDGITAVSRVTFDIEHGEVLALSICLERRRHASGRYRHRDAQWDGEH
jgi:ABC-type phosphonate transport system ATPase subunit